MRLEVFVQPKCRSSREEVVSDVNDLLAYVKSQEHIRRVLDSWTFSSQQNSDNWRTTYPAIITSHKFLDYQNQGMSYLMVAHVVASP
jgi:hypothetical protein